MPLRLTSVVLSEGLARKPFSHSGLTRAPSLVSTGGRFCLFSPWILRQSHQHGLLPDPDLVATDAIILGNDPPALLDGGALVRGLVHVLGRQRGIGRAEQECRQRVDIFLRDIRLRHAQPVHRVRLVLSVIEYGRVGELVFEEALQVIPRPARGFLAVRQDAQLGVFGVTERSPGARWACFLRW